MAAIVKKSGGQVHCGATIIDENYALTAAHCVNSRGSYASDLELLVGEHDYQTCMIIVIVRNFHLSRHYYVDLSIFINSV